MVDIKKETKKNKKRKVFRQISEIIQSSMADDDTKGDIVFKTVCELEENGYKEITLDFNHIDLVNTAFLNNAIGNLFDRDKFNMNKCKVLVMGMDETMMELLLETIRVARQKFIP